MPLLALSVPNGDGVWRALRRRRRRLHSSVTLGRVTWQGKGGKEGSPFKSPSFPPLQERASKRVSGRLKAEMRVFRRGEGGGGTKGLDRDRLRNSEGRRVCKLPLHPNGNSGGQNQNTRSCSLSEDMGA